MINMKNFIIKLAILSCVHSSINAAELSHIEVEQQVKKYVQTNLPRENNENREIITSRLDPRIVIEPCDNDLEMKLPDKPSKRKLNVKIFCTAPAPWQIYLPVKVVIKQAVLIATESIAKGSVLDQNNMAVNFIEESKVRGEVIDNAMVITGAKAKRNISKGTAITKRNICLVCKGESVTIIAKSEHFMLKTSGFAMSHGSIGQQIKVKNSGSGRIVNATVTALNKVIINL